MPTIHDIARKAGVSATTVSRAFRTPGLINDETQQRILEAARLLKYEPRTTKKRRERRTERATIGFQFFANRPEDTLQANTFYAAMLYGAQTEASRLGINLMVHTADRHQLEQDLPQLVEEWEMDGMLLVGGLPDVRLAELYARHLPHVILLDNRDLTGRFESVASDGFGGAYQAVSYLQKLGHRRIGFLLPEAGVEPFEERLRGYHWALYSAGSPAQPDWVLTLNYPVREEENNRRIHAFLTQPEPITALLTANDECAIAVLRLCRQWGIRVPEDLSLIGFDDLPVCEHLAPPLTTLHVEKEFMGRLAVRHIHSRLATDSQSLLEPPVQHTVPVSLVVRESCRGVIGSLGH